MKKDVSLQGQRAAWIVTISHCFHGSRRKAAEKYGCWVWLRSDIHAELHDRNKELDRMLQRECQQRFEELYSHEEFMEIFGKSYL